MRQPSISSFSMFLRWTASKMNNINLGMNPAESLDPAFRLVGNLIVRSGSMT